MIMKKLILIVPLVAGCWALEPPPSQECQSDLDCKGARICVSGSCETPDFEDGSDDGSTPNQPGDCWEEAIECNCNSTYAQPGYVEQNIECESGAHIYDVCGQCANGAYAWYTACYCG